MSAIKNHFHEELLTRQAAPSPQYDALADAWLSTCNTLSSLQDALKTAAPLEGLVLLDLIAAAADLRRKVEQFTEASK